LSRSVLLNIASMSRFISAYHILNVGVIVSYPFFSLWAQHEFPNATSLLVGWEKQTFTTLGAMAAVKFVRKSNIDAFVSDMFMYTKSGILLLSWMMDRRVFSWYCVMYVMLFLYVRKPEYKGPSKIEWMNPATLKRRVLEPDDKDKNVSWLVEFYASWSPPSVNLEPTFADLSCKYTSADLKFAKLDLMRWPYVGEDFGINVSGTSTQLPTLILFERGKETMRIPHVYRDGRIARSRLRASDLIAAFGLDNRKKKSTIKAEFAKAKE
jgi:thiol-disulfide isomerase/thioredoxin